MDEQPFQSTIQTLKDHLADWQENPKPTWTEQKLYLSWLIVLDEEYYAQALDEETKIQLRLMQAKLKEYTPSNLDEDYTNLGNTSRNRYLAELVTEFASNKTDEAMCLIKGGAMGYTVEHEARQNNQGCFLYRTKTDFGETFPQHKLNLDLIQELQNLKKEHVQLRRILPFNKDGGRYVTTYLITHSDSEWIQFQPLLIGKPFKDTAINRIFKALYYGM